MWVTSLVVAVVCVLYMLVARLYLTTHMHFRRHHSSCFSRSVHQQRPLPFFSPRFSISPIILQLPSPALVCQPAHTQHLRPSHFSYPASGSSLRLFKCVFVHAACEPWRQQRRLFLQERKRAMRTAHLCFGRRQGGFLAAVDVVDVVVVVNGRIHIDSLTNS
jgi:hypothetical protein